MLGGEKERGEMRDSDGAITNIGRAKIPRRSIIEGGNRLVGQSLGTAG